MPTENAESIAQRLLEDPTVNPTGLGARDSLRLEGGLCLYGHDLDETTTPVEAGLGWTMGPPKSRRRTEGGFLGSEHILTPDGKFQKVERKRVGILGMKAPAREGTEVYDASGETKIGTITSGTFSPNLKVPIAMAYVDTANSKVGTNVAVKIRNKMQTAEVVKMPFITPGYYKLPE
jgi:aminomethyltransferase